MANRAQEFLNNVEQDEALQAELAKVLEMGTDVKEVIKLAQSKGYEFSESEISAEMEKRQAEHQKKIEAGELNDQELEAVAGGANRATIPDIGKAIKQHKSW
ncbi:MAG: Nif11-like leader peptide family natural product precursor [Cyanobacteria bacterium J06635_10]